MRIPIADPFKVKVLVYIYKVLHDLVLLYFFDHFTTVLCFIYFILFILYSLNVRVMRLPYDLCSSCPSNGDLILLVVLMCNSLISFKSLFNMTLLKMLSLYQPFNLTRQPARPSVLTITLSLLYFFLFSSTAIISFEEWMCLFIMFIDYCILSIFCLSLLDPQRHEYLFCSLICL